MSRSNPPVSLRLQQPELAQIHFGKSETPMANRHRGEIEARFDGQPYRLCLTLGALAELEAAFGDEDMIALAQRFESGRLRAHDCVRIIGAGLRGAGNDIADETVSRMQSDGGVTGFVAIVARLLQATFGAASPSPPSNQPLESDAASREERIPPAPFPGTR